jgi:hypothetical protein
MQECTSPYFEAPKHPPFISKKEKKKRMGGIGELEPSFVGLCV